MVKIINKFNTFIDKKITIYMAIFIFTCGVITIGKLDIITSFILYALGYHVLLRKFETLKEKILLLEFEKDNMLLALCDEDEDLKEYLSNK